MPDSRYQGAFAESYIRSLALASGLNVLHAVVDDDGVDVMVRYSGEVGAVASPGADVQVKSWSTPAGSDTVWHFDGLNEQQYNRLAGGNYQMPRFLVVLVVPAHRNRFAEVLDDGLLLRHHAYFTSVAQEPRIEDPNPRRRRRVLVPKRNVLTPTALRAMLHPGLVVQRSVP
ncbi:DUF4365 domain-containing protein [Micromonospora sp. NBC_01796]|uniref:DUF4365 domain-containing protein n=1 Tax=Micromonospora sp. NBC_01796 TaxID=2975987 RepID=UPI002DD8C417|nr:DUF4365 domain-containing protein [Micromonospora sp. NBC_01796]WSA87903.1 DUF4365 domain-containing protein [Micromonospora sp. NBC_01796]